MRFSFGCKQADGVSDFTLQTGKCSNKLKAMHFQKTMFFERYEHEPPLLLGKVSCDSMLTHVHWSETSVGMKIVDLCLVNRPLYFSTTILCECHYFMSVHIGYL